MSGEIATYYRVSARQHPGSKGRVFRNEEGDEYHQYFGLDPVVDEFLGYPDSIRVTIERFDA